MRMKPRRAIETVVERAARFRVLALGFAYPEPGYRDAMLEALRGLPPGREDFPSAALYSALRDTGDGMLAEEYTRLFLGSGPCSLHETAYGDGRRIAGRPSELADIGGFYAAFGVEISPRHPDLPDLMSTELEFYSLLLVKQAYAQLRNWPEQRAVTARAAHLFLEHHLGRWVSAFAAAVLEHSLFAAYRELARAVAAEVTAECRTLGARPPPATGRVPFDFMHADAFGCPAATEPPVPATP